MLNHNHRKTENIIVKNLRSSQHLLRTTPQTLRSKTAIIIKDDVTSQHSDIVAMCCKVISSFVIFAVLDNASLWMSP